MKEKNNGITLIALIITIIVMLILAAVTINIAVNGGLFGYAGKAAKETNMEKEKEQLEMAYSAAFMKNPLAKVKPADLQEELNNMLGENKAKVSGKKVLFIDSQNEFTISADGTVEEYTIAELTDIYVAPCEGGITLFSNNENDINTYLSQNNLNISSGYEITNIKDEEYWSCYESTNHVIFLNEVVPQSTASWFYCYGLTSIENIRYLNTSRVTDMSYMFCNCYYLEEVDVSGFDTSNVTNMSGMFSTSDDAELRLEELDLSGFDTSNVTDMSAMFQGCTRIKELDITGFNTSNVTNMMSMFNGCLELESIDLSSFDTSNVEYMYYMFKNCDNLKTLDLSNFDTSKVKSMNGMFEYCSNLETIYASDSFVTSGLTGNYSSNDMFLGCDSLKGGCGFACTSSKPRNKTYAKINTPTQDGYFTAKPSGNS